MKNKIFLNATEYKIASRIAASRTDEARKVQRAKILLMYAEGKTQSSIAEIVGLSRPSVLLCIKKFKEAGLEAALNDGARKGRPSIISDDEKTWIRNIACQKPAAFGYAQELWSIKKLRMHIQETCVPAGYPELSNIAKSKVWDILNEAEIKPHRIRYYLENRDPDFDAKMHDVLVVYKQVELLFDENGNLLVNDEPKTVTLSYDEKPGIQAIANIAEDKLPSGDHGFIARDSEYKRMGTVSLLAGMDLLTGEIMPLVRDTHKSSDFIDLLKLLDSKYDKRDKIRLILDNHVIHTSKETRKYLDSVPRRFEFVFTPKHGSWLNLIESFFGKLSRVCLRGIRVASKEELVSRIYQYIEEVNAAPVVYHWKYKMDEIKA
jgi:transposase